MAHPARARSSDHWQSEGLRVAPRLLRKTVMMQDMTELAMIWFTTLVMVAGIACLPH